MDDFKLDYNGKKDDPEMEKMLSNIDYNWIYIINITLEDEDTDYVTLDLNGKPMSSVYLGNSGDWICDAGCGRFKTKAEAVDRMLEHFGLKREDLG